MQRYKNLHHDSGVTAYEIGNDSIQIEFAGEAVYLYTYQSAGRHNIEKMKSLARAGTGLSAFISQQVKNGYAEKLR
jgi:hypothetical protein